EIRAVTSRLALERHALERHQLVLDEAANEIFEHLMLFTEGEVHFSVSTPMSFGSFVSDDLSQARAADRTALLGSARSARPQHWATWPSSSVRAGDRLQGAPQTREMQGSDRATEARRRHRRDACRSGASPDS